MPNKKFNESWNFEYTGKSSKFSVFDMEIDTNDTEN